MKQQDAANSQPTVLASLNAALHRVMAADSRVIFLGEDVLDPYGGAFKVAQGLSSRFPDRVFTTPISEAGIVGVGAGMALRGLRPVVEIMFGDFLTLAADQLINHAAKFRWMYNDQVRVPLVVRTPMGGRRGYGPTHSQTLEKHFLGVPGLRVVAPSACGDPGALLEKLILEGEDPVLFIENKLLYALPLLSSNDADFELSTHWETTSQKQQGNISPLYYKPPHPTYSLSIRGAPPARLILAAYGYMAELARQAALNLAYEKEIFVEIIVPTQLSPFDSQVLLEAARRTGKLLILEEGSLTGGWGAEVAARLTEASGTARVTIRRLAALDLPIPASSALEKVVLPDVGAILHAVVSLL